MDRDVTALPPGQRNLGRHVVHRGIDQGLPLPDCLAVHHEATGNMLRNRCAAAASMSTA